MSKYADRHRQPATCAWPWPPDCPRDGILLNVVDGKPDWFCRAHSEMIDFAVRKGTNIREVKLRELADVLQTGMSDEHEHH